VEDVVDLEAVGVDREADPGEPDGDEQAEVLEEVLGLGVGGEQGRQPRDDDHEDEVEEQLEPRRARLGVGGAQPQT